MTSLIRFIEGALTGTAKACPRCIGSESERIRLDGQRRPRPPLDCVHCGRPSIALMSRI